MKYHLLLILSLSLTQLLSQETFRLVTYNGLRYPNNTNMTTGGTNTDRLAAFQTIMEAINPDVVILQEISTQTAVDDLLNALNTSNLGKTFDRTPNPPDNNFSTGGNICFFNTAIFTFNNENSIPRKNTQLAQDGVTIIDAVRSADIYRLDATTIANPNTSIPIYFISTHLKAGKGGATSDDISDEDNRSLGAKDIMCYINDQLSTTDNVILVGDMNLQDETEPAYIDFTANPTYTELLTEPLGAWTRDNSSPSNVAKYTQSTRTTSNALGNGGAGGGICDRFDFIFYNDEIEVGGNGIAYISNSMTTFGNEGLAVNQSVLSGTNSVKQELYNFSDHFPVIADFELDASNVIIQDCEAYTISTDCNEILEDFTNFSAQGFVAQPSPGQLCSFAWNFDGFDENYQFGTDNFGDFALGSTQGGVGQGGIYEKDGALWIQPTSTTFTPGSAVLKACNTSSSNIQALDIAYDLLILNDNNRASQTNFSYSLDSTSFINIPALSFISTEQANDMLDTISQNTSITNLSITPNQCIYLRWSGDDASGSGSRDEFGIDNISICVTATTCPDSLAINDNPITADTYQAKTISSTGIIPLDTTVNFEAENTIYLRAGFHATGIFTARITPCSSSSINNHLPLSQKIKNNDSPKTANNITIYPNPSHGSITLNFQIPESTFLKIDLLNIHGQTVQSIANQQFDKGTHQIKMENNLLLKKGIYYIQFQGGINQYHTLVKL